MKEATGWVGKDLKLYASLNNKLSRSLHLEQAGVVDARISICIYVVLSYLHSSSIHFACRRCTFLPTKSLHIFFYAYTNLLYAYNTFTLSLMHRPWAPPCMSPLLKVLLIHLLFTKHSFIHLVILLLWFHSSFNVYILYSRFYILYPITITPT